MGASKAADPGELDELSRADLRRLLRDMGAIVALPALWVDHEPPEIANGLLSVLFGMLSLDGAYARFDDPMGGPALEAWRPSVPSVPTEFLRWLAIGHDSGPTFSSARFEESRTRVVSIPIALPWARGVVLVSAARTDFPTVVETNLLRLAVNQGAVAVHTARHLVREHRARLSAEEALLRQGERLSALARDIEPSLASISRRANEVSLLVAEANAPGGTGGRAPTSTGGTDAAHHDLDSPVPLTGREVEVLGLLAQGLSNREIAGVIRLSDKTVERHITSVYRKVGVARRSEATAFAFRHGVV